MNSTARYLVICGNGPNSLHERWLTGQMPLFDVLLSPYDGAPFEVPATWPGGYSGRDAGRAFLHIRGAERNVMPEILVAWRDYLPHYDYIMLMPDDIDVPGSAATINRLFVTAERDGFDLCQPALLGPDAPGRYGVYEVLFQRPQSLYRCLTMIESMCPIFSQRAWQAVAPAWGVGKHGTNWGIEGAWSVLLGAENGRTRFGGKIGVIDYYPVAHTRPQNPGDEKTRADHAAMRQAYPEGRFWPAETGEAWRMPADPLPITLTIVVRNEAHRLGRMLAWHDPFIWQNLVVVQESDDDTLAVANSFAQVVIERPAAGYCERDRHTAHCGVCDWTLCLDADEFLTEPFRAWLCRTFGDYVPEGGPYGDGYRLRRQNWRDGERAWPLEGEGPGDAQYRFYRHDAVYFLDEIHTEPQPTGHVEVWGDGWPDRIGWCAAIDHVKTTAEQQADEERCERLLGEGGACEGDPFARKKLALNTTTRSGESAAGVPK